ncbi:MAG: DUF2269 family protein [Thermoleophilia bacterium]|nr:DUF2269 family protein [Thermoleophilia bacterium]
MSRFEIALVLHVLGAIVMLGGIITAGLAFYAARRRRRPSEIAAILSLSRWGVVTGAVGFLLVTAFGLWLVTLGGFGYGADWLVATYVLFGVSNLLGGVTGRPLKRARLLAERLAASDDPPTDELHRLLRDRPAEILNHLSTALMLAVLVLMVWRPGS